MWNRIACALVVLSLLSTGCVTSRGQPLFGLQWPKLFHPGTQEMQRNNAALHDPYPDPDAGPEVVGNRPREFQQPLPEPVKNRGLRDSWWQR